MACEVWMDLRMLEFIMLNREVRVGGMNLDITHTRKSTNCSLIHMDLGKSQMPKYITK